MAKAFAPAWRGVLDELLEELHRRSRAACFAISRENLGAWLDEIAAKYLPAEATASDCRELLSSLKLEDLVLARACAAGNEAAWEAFLLRFREKLYDAARAIAREESLARELADSLYADLYGTSCREGQRISKLSSYMGRGSLEGWMRTVLAQAYVDRYRRERRLVSLEEEDEAGVQFAAQQKAESPAPDPRLEAAADEALAVVASDDRFILAAYFLDGRTLAEIARMLHVHESTISRRLDKVTASLRKHIRGGLVKRGMSHRQAEEALEADVRDLQVNVRARLAQESGPSAFSKKGSDETR